jgi:hypothetical protein
LARFGRCPAVLKGLSGRCERADEVEEVLWQSVFFVFGRGGGVVRLVVRELSSFLELVCLLEEAVLESVGVLVVMFVFGVHSGVRSSVGVGVGVTSGRRRRRRRRRRRSISVFILVCDLVCESVLERE